MRRAMKRLAIRGAFLCGLCALGVVAAFTFISCGGGSSAATTTPTTPPSYSQQATYGVQTLQNWYVQSSGLYQSPTFANANQANGSTNFITSANDDEGWWALAWMDAYDLTGNQAYLTMAQTIFADMATQWDTSTCGGGVWWSKDLTNSAYKNAITNEIFLKLAAGLANRTTEGMDLVQGFQHD